MIDPRWAATGSMSRRDALQRAAGAGIAALLSPWPSLDAQVGAPPVAPRPTDPNFPVPPGWKTELRQLAANVFAYVQAGGPGLGSGAGISNAGIVVGPNHLLLIDTLSAPLHIKGLLDAVGRTVGNQPFGRVINTHHHGDHVGNNQLFESCEIVGHEYCRETVLNLQWPAVWERREGWAEGGEVRKIVAPGTTITDKITYRYGNAVVEVLHLGVAHTWGDVVVYLPQPRVLFAGDISLHRVVPFAHAGQVTRWLEVIDKILAMDVETIVPGHGPIGGKRELTEMADYLRTLKREARTRFDAGMSAGRAAAEIRLGKFDNWIGSERIVLNTFRLYCEFDGTLTPVLDVPRLKKVADEYHAITGLTPPLVPGD